MPRRFRLHPGCESAPCARLAGARPAGRETWRPPRRASAGLGLALAWLGTMAGCASASPAERRLVWSDDFNQPVGSAPSAERWVFNLGGGGWGNRELQTYTDARANSAVVADPAASDGRALAIRAERSAAGAYTSARLTTKGKFAVKFGRVEARLKLTRGRGVWPAFWMLGDGFPQVKWPDCGEIDIMEQLGHEPGRTHGTLHGPGYAGGQGPTASTTLPAGAALSDAYHVFAIEWTPQKIEWSLDGKIFVTRTPASLPAGTRWVFDQPAFLLLNLAVGGNWPGSPDAATVFPQTFLVDYIRVYAPAAPSAG